MSDALAKAAQAAIPPAPVRQRHDAPQPPGAIANLRKICEEHLAGRYDLEIIDVYQQPVLAKDEQILSIP